MLLIESSFVCSFIDVTFTLFYAAGLYAAFNLSLFFVILSIFYKMHLSSFGRFMSLTEASPTRTAQVYLAIEPLLSSKQAWLVLDQVKRRAIETQMPADRNGPGKTVE